MMAIHVHNKFQTKLLSVHRALLQIHADPKKYGAVAKEMAGLASQSTNNNGEVLLPSYFRKCFETELGHDDIILLHLALCEADFTL